MSVNDPNWGTGGPPPPGGSGGPPDLDELWRDFNRRLTGMFGGKGASERNSGPSGTGGKGPNDTEPRQFGNGLTLLLMLAVVAWLGTGFYQVEASQRGVVMQFGRYLETTEPGLRWRLPWPIQSHEIVNTTAVRTVEIGYRGTEKNRVTKESLMLTDDENIVSVQFAVQYLIKDPISYVFQNRHPDDAVTQAAETAIREIVGKSKMDFVLYEGRDAIAAKTQKLIQDILDRYETGVQIRSVTMQGAQPPEQVQAAFDDAVKAGQDRERQKNEGQAYANDVVPRAAGAAARLIQEAEGYRQRVINNAQGEAARFKQILPEYAKAPQVTRERMYLDAMQQIYSSTSKIVLDYKGGNNMLYLPLDKILQMTGSAAPAETTTSAPSAAPENPPAEPQTAPARSRDILRSRERGER